MDEGGAGKMNTSDMIKELRERAEDRRHMEKMNQKAFGVLRDSTAGQFEDEVASRLEELTGLTPARHGRSAALRAQVLKVIEYEMEFFTPTGKQAARCILHKLDEKVFNQPRGLSASDGPSSPEAVNPKETSP
jgi:hypothetical protein